MEPKIGTAVCGTARTVVRGRKTRVGEKLLRFPPTRFLKVEHRLRSVEKTKSLELSSKIS